MKAKITVIVPIYNVEKYVVKCLKSLSNQTFKDFVVWAVNDGSPDNSAQIVKEYCKKDSRINLINKTNGGYGSVLQYCIKSIKTKYFLICDPDDWLKENALAELYAEALKTEADLVVGEKYDVFVGGNKAYRSFIGYENVIKNIRPTKVYTSNSDIQLFSFFNTSPHAKLYKTTISKAIKFPSKVSYTDFLLYLVSLTRVKKIVYLNKPLAYYLQDREGNTFTSKKISKFSDYMIVWFSTYNQINESHQNTDILKYRLFIQLKMILNEYSLIVSKPFQDKYGVEIIRALKCLQSSSKCIEELSQKYGSVIQRSVAKHFMNSRKYIKYTCKYVLFLQLKHRIGKYLKR